MLKKDRLDLKLKLKKHSRLLYLLVLSPLSFCTPIVVLRALLWSMMMIYLRVRPIYIDEIGVVQGQNGRTIGWSGAAPPIGLKSAAWAIISSLWILSRTASCSVSTSNMIGIINMNAKQEPFQSSLNVNFFTMFHSMYPWLMNLNKKFVSFLISLSCELSFFLPPLPFFWPPILGLYQTSWVSSDSVGFCMALTLQHPRQFCLRRCLQPLWPWHHLTWFFPLLGRPLLTNTTCYIY